MYLHALVSLYSIRAFLSFYFLSSGEVVGASLCPMGDIGGSAAIVPRGDIILDRYFTSSMLAYQKRWKRINASLHGRGHVG